MFTITDVNNSFNTSVSINHSLGKVLQSFIKNIVKGNSP